MKAHAVAAMPIYVWPCALITARTVDVIAFDHSLFLLCERMAKTLEGTRNIIGGDMLAATQIGDTRKVVMLRADRDSLMTLINPRVIDARKLQVADEFDLSFPAAKVPVSRPSYVLIEYSGVTGERKTAHLENQLARDAGRGIEYLDGRSLFDHAGWWKRRELKSKYKKAARNRFPARVDHLSQQAAWHTLIGGGNPAGEEE